MTIDIYAGDVLIGEAVLDEIDEGMGVAVGPFRPSPRYCEVRPQITAAAEARHQRRSSESPRLEARSKLGEVLATGFVVIDDFADVAVDPEATVQFTDPAELVKAKGPGEHAD